MKQIHYVLIVILSISLGIMGWTLSSKQETMGSLNQKVIEVNRGISQISKDCITCHQDQNPLIVLDWKNSLHGRSNVTCLDCHQADKNETDSFQCQGLRRTKVHITSVPTPKDCSRCHPVEAEQFAASDHAIGYDSIKKLKSMSIDWEGKGSTAPEATGCVQCHGGIIEFDKGRPGGDHYPQEGIGRVNPDGSSGNCTSCHTRHLFSIVEARKGDTCGACHMGPDHPQIEIWEESKHGKRTRAEGDSWTWDSAPDAWEPGDYSAPTCAVCHMSGISDLSTSHNISLRLSWQAERPLSVRTADWEKNRLMMKKVCLSCHSPSWVNGFYNQYDLAIQTYNEKYYKPAKTMIDELYELNLITKDNPWDDEIELIFYHLWHHEGRRARMGTAMMGQDYAHWHGFFELAQDLDQMKKEYQRLKSGHKQSN
ncbi:MAG: beta-ketoacyl-ACP synthase [Candidatus Aminicenantes bacterium]|nr:beta-ketoacyl-ACP synthase [Candidatus Aminicenantes bacterium]